VPYLAILERLLGVVPGSLGALLLDVAGEVVVMAGLSDMRHRLIGAYQGIALATARRTAERYSAGAMQELVCRYEGGTLIVRPLVDGYYLVLSLSPEASVARALWFARKAQVELDAEL
jgi:predicted regulator of Ras-like GTPase activity (Roadblock/LC7/MglB family)